MIDSIEALAVPPSFVPGDQPDPFATDPPPSRTVLYVEDHPVNIVLMQALFSRRPQVRLVVATTGEAGVRAAQSELPDLLLLDLRLPDCHGTELLQRLRALPALEDVPAVAVTAEDIEGLGAWGFAEIWQKPMDLNATLARLDRLLDRPATGKAPNAAATVPPGPGWPRVAGRGRRAPPAPIPFPTADAQGEPRGSFDAM